HRDEQGEAIRRIRRRDVVEGDDRQASDGPVAEVVAIDRARDDVVRRVVREQEVRHPCDRARAEEDERAHRISSEGRSRSLGRSSWNGSIAPGGGSTPSPRTTFWSVIARIRMSSASDQLSTYQTSRARRSCIWIRRRPLTWAQPVIPGRASCLRASSGVYRPRYS